MKITLSKKQWESIGKKAGWFSKNKEEKVQSKTWIHWYGEGYQMNEPPKREQFELEDDFTEAEEAYRTGMLQKNLSLDFNTPWGQP